MKAIEPVVHDHRALWSGLASTDEDAEVGVLGVPFDGAAQHRRGSAQAPGKLRDLTVQLAPSTEEGVPLRVRVRDYGDVPSDLAWPRDLHLVEDRALEALRHPLALFLGGDHSVGIPLMRAFARAVNGPFGVVHFDAHFDLWDIMHGDRWAHACTERRALELEGMDPAHMVFVGVRGFCPEDWETMDAYPGIRYHTARQCYRRGIETVAGEVVDRLRGVPAVYVTIDIDGLDPAYAPGTGTPEGGGPSTRDLIELMRIIVGELPVRAMDVVEISPPLDPSDATSFAALKVIYEVWGALQEKL
jgi:agmatinase